MITCELNGRLGNQMFQIATTIATALKYNVPYSIPQRTLNDWFPVYFKHLPFIPHSGKMYSHHETKYEYEEIKYPGRTLKLNGYFQSYKYFEDYRKEIIKAFRLAGWCKVKEVSIHVRRGDYLTNPDFSVLGIYYYYQSINFFREKGYKKFIVFSDDMDWCKKNINSELYKDCEFDYSENKSEKEDMEYMNVCEHNIISNSSFSWWAAWLNQNPDKIVVAPTTLFKNANKDMIPESWIRINNE